MNTEHIIQSEFQKLIQRVANLRMLDETEIADRVLKEYKTEKSLSDEDFMLEAYRYSMPGTDAMTTEQFVAYWLKTKGFKPMEKQSNE